MKKIKKIIYSILMLIQIFFSTIFINDNLFSKNPGQSNFEKAYSIEKENPDLAIELYKKAIQEGLTFDLRKTANWRLYFLYMKKKYFFQAYQILNLLSNKETIKKKFFEDVEYFTKIKKDEFISLYQTLNSNDLEKVKDIYNKSNIYIKNEILSFYSENNKNHIIESLISSDKSNNIENKLFVVNYYMNKEKYQEAEKILLELSKNNEQLTISHKKLILNELGKIKRKTNILESIPYFLLSTNYTSSVEEYERQLALAIYSIYRTENYKIAYEFFDFLYYEPRETQQKIFYLLLKAEKNPTKQNISELKKYILTSEDKESILIQRAKKIINTYENEK